MDKNTLDPFLDLLTVLFLKSEDQLKVTLLRDIYTVFRTIKENEYKIIIEKSFLWKIWLPRINQF